MILDQDRIDQVLQQLEKPNEAFNQIYKGRKVGRKPVHTVYGGAHLYIAERTDRMGKAALQSFNTYIANFGEFAHALKLQNHKRIPTDPQKVSSLELDLMNSKHREHPAWLAFTVYNRVINKLKTEPVEDFRIDFEDGFGKRTDKEEDHYAELTAKEVIKAMDLDLLPPFIGIRIKPLTEELKNRSIRTLNIFLSTLLEGTGGQLPDNFIVTLPKVTKPEEVEILSAILRDIEEQQDLPGASIKMEIMVETPQSIIGAEGESNIPLLVEPARDRITGAHFGVYDYTASVDIIANYQEMDHQVCDFARHMMKVGLAGTGIRLSDGATNILPVGPHKAKENETLTSSQRHENRKVVINAWNKGFNHILHSLENGYYQGWDLHPAQLPIRYAAVYSFFLSHLQQSITRLKSFVDRAAQATLTGDVFDDAATALALLNYFNLGLEAKAITEDEARETGLTMEEIQKQSFDYIMENRSQQTT